jgi:signal transduction histidine kinase
VGIPGALLCPGGFRRLAAPQAAHRAGRDAGRFGGHHGAEAGHAGERPGDRRQAQARTELLRAQAVAQTALAERLRRRVFDTNPTEARDALAAIEATSRQTLSGLRRMVTGLRRAELGPGSEQALLGPAPGLAGIERLAALTLDAGVKVDVDWRGSREPLRADIDLSAFRIIQEAVTNVVRHAGTDECWVLIEQQDGQLLLEVTDRGRGGPVSKSSAAETGYGITGMRERATLLGGDFSAGPRPGGGFRIAARLPLPAAEQ